MNPFLKLFCFWLLALCCVKEANSYPLDVFSKQQKNFCLLYKLAPTLSNVPYLKNLLGYDTTAPAGEPFAVFVHEENEIETVKYCSSEKISSAIVEECVGHCKGRRRSEAAAVEFSLQAVCKKKSYEVCMSSNSLLFYPHLHNESYSVNNVKIMVASLLTSRIAVEYV